LYHNALKAAVTSRWSRIEAEPWKDLLIINEHRQASALRLLCWRRIACRHCEDFERDGQLLKHVFDIGATRAIRATIQLIDLWGITAKLWTPRTC